MAYFLMFIFLSLSELVSSLGKYFSYRYAGKTYFVLLFAVMVIFAGFRAPGIDPDYSNYIEWLHSTYNNPSEIFTQFKDPGFTGLYVVLKFLSIPDTIFFCVVAFISLQAKSVFSKYIMNGAWAYLLFFMICSRFYIVHDLIQIRVGVAISLASCALVSIYRGGRFGALAVYLLALSFHLSVIMFAPIIFMVWFGFRFLNRFSLILIPALSFVFSGAIVLLSGQLRSIERLAPYINGEYQTTAVSLFSFYFIVRLALLSFIISSLYRKMSDFERFLVFMSVMGLSLQALLSWNDSLSLRFAELFGFFDMACFLVVTRFFEKKSQILYVIGLVGLGGLLYFSSTKLVAEYAASFS